MTLLIAVDDATGTVAQGGIPHQRGHPWLPGAPGGPDPSVGNPPWPSNSDRHAAFKYNARQKPVPVETTHQFARVMRELGIQQIFALSPQAKGRVERMLETFQDRLVTGTAPWPEPAPSTRPRRSSRSFCPRSTPASRSRPSTPRRPTARCRPNCL